MSAYFLVLLAYLVLGFVRGSEAVFVLLGQGLEFGIGVGGEREVGARSQA